jgi:hypothetical protein
MAAPHVAGAAALEVAANGRALNAAGVAEIRQALIDAAEPQSAWGPANTFDPDANPEGLANVASGPLDYPPTVAITSPAEGSVSGTIDITATATDDNAVTQVEFFVDGASIGVDTTAPYAASWNTTTVTDGPYTVKATATDTANQTASHSISVTVDNYAPAEATVSVTLPNGTDGYSTQGGMNGDKHLLFTVVLVDDLGAAVANASVSIDLYRDEGFIASETATTGADGTATFTLKNASSGCYTTSVTDVLAAGLTWDYVTPVNQFCK